MTPAGCNQLMQDEGLRLFVYDDKSGATITHGPAGGSPTIGYGRNLIGRGISEAEAVFLLNNDIGAVTAQLVLAYEGFLQLPFVWQDVAINETFNTGKPFPEMMQAMLAGDAQGAHDQLLNSVAAREAPARYQRLAAAVLANSWGDAITILIPSSPAPSA